MVELSQGRLLVAVLATLSLCAACFIGGWFGAPREEHTVTTFRMAKSFDQMLADRLVEFPIIDDVKKVDRKKIREELKFLTSHPHMAGTKRDAEMAQYIANKWKGYGFDNVDINHYEVLLSYPDKDKANRVSIIQNGKNIFQSSNKEDDPQQLIDPDFVTAFLAYTPAGRVDSRKVVYVNYGRTEDFAVLTDSASPFFTDLKGAICMARYGQIYRGNKVRNAATAGCSGAILFSDPADVAKEGVKKENVYPNTKWLPPSGIQRGSTFIGIGDPETPTWPSLKGVYRIKDQDLLEVLPSIPAQPINYADAKKILEMLEGKKVPDGWAGGISGIDYKLGGSFSLNSPCRQQDCLVRVETFNKRERKDVPTVIGVIRGQVEPDRYVLFGNHRDAWGYGAVDPSTGTVTLLEMTRILGQKLKTSSWRPRRTLVFISWGAEEHGLVDSREFVEDFLPKLTDRAVAYINVDSVVGAMMASSASPTMTNVVVNAAKAVPDPRNTSRTYFDYWHGDLKTHPKYNASVGYKAFIKIPGSSTDHSAFIFHAGIPVLDINFSGDIKSPDFTQSMLWPAYHTAFETFRYTDEQLDPGSFNMATSSSLALAVMRELGDRPILSLEPQNYAELLQSSWDDLKSKGLVDKLKALQLPTEELSFRITEFTSAVRRWQKQLNSTKADLQTQPLMARAINDQMMKLDRAFILINGLPNRPQFRHAIISPSVHNKYGSGAFPGIVDLLFDLEKGNGDAVKNEDLLARHVTDLIVAVKAAKDFINDVGTIV